MTRGVPILKRVRETRYQTSDGKSFASHIEAFRHETEVQLEAFIKLRLVTYHDDAHELAQALLRNEEFRVVMLGPRGPAGGKGGTP